MWRFSKEVKGQFYHGHVNNYHGQVENYHGQVNNYHGQVENYHGQENNYHGQVDNYHGQVNNYHGQENNYNGQDSNLTSLGLVHRSLAEEAADCHSCKAWKPFFSYMAWKSWWWRAE